eukprot:TRINITY_DN13989_c0_g2_i1.p1 TRINITY_DN13989_c0_g2~~TRINITY_DN13989_c0_g2_i1.p1  ORF type:complete len:619 (-),score=92.00 TRINITY_DN13989_c0_g2_i1:126-1982(-)
MAAAEAARFVDPWWRKYDVPAHGFVDASGKVCRLPLRLESREVIVYGLVDAAKMWETCDALNEPFVPVLVGGRAVVAIWFNDFSDTDCGGAYLETWYNTFVTPKGEPQLELPYDSPMSAIIQDPRSLSYLQRVLCSEAPKSTGAGAVAVEVGRSVWGFPKHPQLAEIQVKYDAEADKTQVNFEAAHLGKEAVLLQATLPKEGEDGTLTLQLEAETPANAMIGGPLMGGTHKGHNGSLQTRYGVAFKCTQHIRPWDASSDSLQFGDDAHYASAIAQWNFEPVLKAYSPDFKIVAQKPSNWISGEASGEQAAAGDVERFTDPWFCKYDKPTDGFLDSSGSLCRLPLRSEGAEVIIYCLVDANKMWTTFKSLGEDAFVPILVGGKAVVGIWFKSFIDTDCGGAYLEVGYNTFVSRSSEAQLDLPYKDPMSTMIADQRSLSYLQRVLCSEAAESTGAAAVAVEGGRSVWGSPKHPELARISFEYLDDKKKVEVDASHVGKKAVSLKVVLPQPREQGTFTLPVEVETAPDAIISGPRLGGTHQGHNGSHQVRHGVAMKYAQHARAWDAETDCLDFGDDGHYASPIKAWDVEPVLKVYSADFKMVAQTPSNWLSGVEVAKRLGF